MRERTPGEPVPKGRVRVAPEKTATIGTAKVANKTSNTIEVEVQPDGSVVVTDCCLEEQGK